MTDAEPSPVSRCPNCGHAVPDAFCGRCGQRAVDHRRPLSALLGDLQNQVFAFDSRTWTTLKLLLRRPGFLTVEYNAGRRLRYLPPVRLYLLISFFFFLLLGITDPQIVRFTGSPSGAASMNVGWNEESAAGQPADGAEAETPTADTPGASPSATEPPAADSTAAQPPAADPSAAAPTGEASAGRASAGRASTSLSFGEEESGLAAFFSGRMERVYERYKNPQAEINQLVSRRIPQTMFFLVPMMAALLKLFYVRQRKFFVEHLVFAVHFHAFTFLIVFVLRGLDTVLGLLTGEDQRLFSLATVVLLAIYLLLALRRVYEQSWLMTLLKAVLLALFYSVFFLISLVATLAATVAMM